MSRGPKFFPDYRPSPPPRVCATCGRPARFGFGVALRKGREGTWYCAEHKPK